jgi:hypothetical protein
MSLKSPLASRSLAGKPKCRRRQIDDNAFGIGDVVDRKRRRTIEIDDDAGSCIVADDTRSIGKQALFTGGNRRSPRNVAATATADMIRKQQRPEELRPQSGFYRRAPHSAIQPTVTPQLSSTPDFAIHALATKDNCHCRSDRIASSIASFYDRANPSILWHIWLFPCYCDGENIQACSG